jgi:hypothetical protein
MARLRLRGDAEMAIVWAALFIVIFEVVSFQLHMS